MIALDVSSELRYILRNILKENYTIIVYITLSMTINKNKRFKRQIKQSMIPVTLVTYNIGFGSIFIVYYID